MSLHAIGQWFRYRMRAMGRHGMHSPYVYALIEQGLMPPTAPSADKPLPHPERPELYRALRDSDLFTRLLRHFNIRRILSCPGSGGGDPVLLQIVSYQNRLFVIREDMPVRGMQETDRQDADMLILGDNPTLWTEQLSDHRHILAPSGLCLAPSIHQNKEATRCWEQLRKTEGLRLSLDFYQLGLLSFNPALKEPRHFCVRYFRGRPFAAGK